MQKQIELYEHYIPAVVGCLRQYPLFRSLERSYEEQNKLLQKSLALLRRVYNDIEMCHLNDNTLSSWYVDKIRFHKQLGDDIFNLLQSKDEFFRKTTIRRQKRWRRREKAKRRLRRE